MKKMKGIIAMENSSLYGAGYEDLKIRSKHQSLMQDYQELYKETEEMRNKLERAKHKKFTLLAEVRFLRSRFDLLTNPPKYTPPKKFFARKEKLVARNKNVISEKNCVRMKAAFRKSNNGLELKRKEQINSGRDMDAPPRAPAPIFDSTKVERAYNGKNSALGNPCRVFDLNQISTEEEEFQATQVYPEPIKIEEPKKYLVKNTTEEHIEQHNDMKLTICRNLGNRSNRAGKRKISWQDQVALRV